MRQRIPDEVERAHLGILPGEEDRYHEEYRMIQYLNENQHSNCGFDCGYTEPGYYFWDETQAYCHGPYKTVAEANHYLYHYCQHLNSVPPKPRYLHDCDDCVFLGQFKEYDLYVHPDYEADTSRYIKTVIARYSDDEPEYLSGAIYAHATLKTVWLSKESFILYEAWLRAVRLGWTDSAAHLVPKRIY